MTYKSIPSSNIVDISQSVIRSPKTFVMGGSLKTLTQLIKSIFATGEQGFAYDPNDLTTLYQDAAGTIPVTAAGQPVGLVLDKSKGLVLSPNRCVNGDFSAGLSGWVSNGNYWTVVGGRAYHALGAVLNALDQAFTATTATATYLEFTAEVLTAVNTAQVQFVPSGTTVNFTTGLQRIAVPVGTTNIQFKRVPSTSAEFYVDNVAVRSVLGNHAYQTVSASRPILRQTPILGNELVVNGDFSAGLTGWGTVAANALVQDGGCVVTATGAGSRIGQTLNTVVGKTYKVSFTSLSNAFNLDARVGTYPAAMGATLSSVSTLRTGGYSLLFTATTTTTSIYTNSYIGAGYSYSIDNISVREITGYRTDQNYLEFDGVDDSLRTNNIDFTATNKVSLFAGVRKMSDANAGVLLELSTSVANTGTFVITSPPNGSEPSYSAGSNLGLLTAPKTPMIFSAPRSDVLTMRATGNPSSISLRVNSTQAASSAVSHGAGNYGNHPLYIGRRAGTSLPFNGHLYSLIGIGRLTSDSETIALEKTIAKNTGVTLNV